MKLFRCQHCGQVLYFENTQCERCGRRLGFLPDAMTLTALEPAGDGLWQPLAAPEELVRPCLNAEHDACNWLVPVTSGELFCRGCRLNRTIPNLSVPNHLVLWQRLEVAKRRLLYGLLRLGLPLASRNDDPENGLCFDFLAGSGVAFHEDQAVATGHANGVITIDVAEADDVERERQRQVLAEPYRTLLGHFRHEIGHYYWERLVWNGPRHEAARAMFGDEREDYAAALERHYASGPPSDWRERHVSSYASAHPWEDFAETWAHYLHIVDTVETAGTFGMELHAGMERNPELEMAIDFDPYDQPDLERLIAVWLPLTSAVNSLNHSMGQPDLYPFVLSATVIEKLGFIHGLIYDRGTGIADGDASTAGFASGEQNPHTPSL